MSNRYLDDYFEQTNAAAQPQRYSRPSTPFRSNGGAPADRAMAAVDRAMKIPTGPAPKLVTVDPLTNRLSIPHYSAPARAMGLSPDTRPGVANDAPAPGASGSPLSGVDGALSPKDRAILERFVSEYSREPAMRDAELALGGVARAMSAGPRAQGRADFARENMEHAVADPRVQIRYNRPGYLDVQKDPRAQTRYCRLDGRDAGGA